MPDPDDELDRLSSVDPIDRSSLPSASGPAARALFERITMTDTPVRSRRPVIIASAAALVLVVGAVTLTFGLTDGGGSHDTAASPSTTAVPENRPGAGGPVTSGGSIGSCVERYDLSTLAHRELAFDGTVENVSGDRVTFTVNRWYRGGGGGEVTLGGAEVVGGITSAGPGTNLQPGTRLLVAGDGGFAWSCGFTQPYHAEIADQWQRTLTS